MLALSLGVLGLLTTTARVEADPLTISAGDDLLVTNAGTLLGTIHADFFGPGSDPFTDVLLVGVPLSPGDFGDADTIVRRKDPLDFVDISAVALQVPIEIIALNLVNAVPIFVTFDGGQFPEEWNLRVCLTTGVSQPPSTMDITRTHENGGTFTSELHVTATLIATKVTAPFTVEEMPLVDEILTPVDPPFNWVADSPFGLVVAPGLQVVSQCDGTTKTLLGTSSNFKFGVRQLDTDVDPATEPIPCQVVEVSEEQSDNVKHNVSIPGFTDASCCIKSGPNKGQCQLFTAPDPPNDPGFGASDCQDAGNDVIGGNGSSCATKTGACCLPDDTCVNNSNKCCCELLGGAFVIGPNGTCQGDSDGNGIDDLCDGSIPTVSQWGLGAIALLILAAGTILIVRRRSVIAGA